MRRRRYLMVGLDHRLRRFAHGDRSRVLAMLLYSTIERDLRVGVCRMGMGMLWMGVRV